MDKAQYTFEKYAGAWDKITRFFSRSGKYLKKSVKVDPNPATKTFKQIKDLKSFEAARGKVTSPVMQRQLETQINKTVWTGGKRPVSVLSKDQLAEAVQKEKYLRNMGM